MPTPTDTSQYYQAALLGLHALESRQSRALRFGPNADATWAAFAAGLHTAADRLELLLRDAAVTWGAAFSAQAVFGLDAIATDEPFGPAWLHRNTTSLQAPGPATLPAIAAALQLPVHRHELPALTSSARLLLAGPSALVAAATAFADRPDLSWDRQVTAIADLPAHRQLAGLCALFAGADAATKLLRTTDPLPPGTAVVSTDAEPAARQRLGLA